MITLKQEVLKIILYQIIRTFQITSFKQITSPWYVTNHTLHKNFKFNIKNLKTYLNKKKS